MNKNPMRRKQRHPARASGDDSDAKYRKRERFVQQALIERPLAAHVVALAAARAASVPRGMRGLGLNRSVLPGVVDPVTQRSIPIRRAVRINKQWFNSKGLSNLLRHNPAATNPLTRQPLPAKVRARYGGHGHPTSRGAAYVRAAFADFRVLRTGRDRPAKLSQLGWRPVPGDRYTFTKTWGQARDLVAEVGLGYGGQLSLHMETPHDSGSLIWHEDGDVELMDEFDAADLHAAFERGMSSL